MGWFVERSIAGCVSYKPKLARSRWLTNRRHDHRRRLRLRPWRTHRGNRIVLMMAIIVSVVAVCAANKRERYE
jgi:hypothetical protein